MNLKARRHQHVKMSLNLPRLILVRRDSEPDSGNPAVLLLHWSEDLDDFHSSRSLAVGVEHISKFPT